MLEKSFGQILSKFLIDVQSEYHKLHELFYDNVAYSQKSQFSYVNKTFSLYDLVGIHFQSFPYRRTILTINEFDTVFDFNFRFNESNIDLEKLVQFCEYVYNLVSFTLDGQGYDYAELVLNHIRCLANEIQYSIKSDETGLFFFVLNDPEILSVCSAVDESISTQILKYSHHSLKGNLAKKSQIISAMAKELESIRDDSKFHYSNLFFAYANNCHIRHYNLNGDKKKIFVSKMDNYELEELYDMIFRVGVIAFAEYNNKDTIQFLKDNKDEINRKEDESIR